VVEGTVLRVYSHADAVQVPCLLKLSCGKGFSDISRDSRCCRDVA
jgi:hypothetical protein